MLPTLVEIPSFQPVVGDTLVIRVKRVAASTQEYLAPSVHSLKKVKLKTLPPPFFFRVLYFLLY